jgi:hypothetical protein
MWSVTHFLVGGSGVYAPEHGLGLRMVVVCRGFPVCPGIQTVCLCSLFSLVSVCLGVRLYSRP